MRILIILLFVSAVCFGQGIKTNNQTGGTNTVVQNGETVVSTVDKELFNDVTKSKTLPVIKVDSMDIKVISMKEFNIYLNRISIAAMKQFDLTEKAKYDAILKELLTIQAEVDKKRKSK